MSEDKAKKLMVQYKDTDLGGFLLDSDQFENLGSFEKQIKYQTELLTCFYNQQPDFANAQDLSPATNRVKIETKSMTNLTSDDEFNPFLTFLKYKTDLILPSKVSKKKAMEIWTEYKKAINKILPTVRSHITSQNCNITILLTILARFIVRKGGGLGEIMRNMNIAVDFAVEYMAIYYQLDILSKQSVDLTQIFRFGSFQVLFKNEEVSCLINDTVNDECFSQGKQVSAKFNDIITNLKQIPKVAHYLDKKSAQEKAERIALLTEKKNCSLPLPRSPNKDEQ